MAVLKRIDRVHNIKLREISSLHLEKVLAAMQVQFPVLTDLMFESYDKTESVPLVPDSFLGGSAPRLKTLCLRAIPFPGLLKLLLSAANLVEIYLWNIPHSGYFSPEAMVTALSALTSLWSLWLGFQSPRSCPGRRLPFMQPCVLPVLDCIIFKGISEYLGDLVARINYRCT